MTWRECGLKLERARNVSGNRRCASRGCQERTSLGIPQAISVVSSPSGKTQLNFKMICKRPTTLPHSCAFTMFSPLERLPVHQPARPGIPEFKPENTNTPYPRDSATAPIVPYPHFFNQNRRKTTINS
ncbi:hypothetical protein TcasGA2_TC004687 [Tribolium castaneum]|uniref:Uncharacterized protein n=1 Tax=Tribolium castaneum TaxID=7070 RepID=D6W677_TRICA|nr:hypothetical protein TcasGA2_TC004687 [Tribolium castaneum]